MKIKKNLKKTKADGFNVWDVMTSISEIALIVAVVIGLVLYLYTYYTLKT